MLTSYSVCDKVFSRPFFFFAPALYAALYGTFHTQDIETYPLCMKCTY
jgi:hypothetical protein